MGGGASSVVAAIAVRTVVLGGTATGDGAPTSATRASIAARMAAMWSGVVPQQPPTIAAPASSMSPTIRPK